MRAGRLGIVLAAAMAFGCGRVTDSDDGAGGPASGHDSQTNPEGGRLWIKAGSYTGSGNFPLTIAKPMEISSYWGDVDIAGKLHLKHSGSIRLPPNYGTLKIR